MKKFTLVCLVCLCSLSTFATLTLTEQWNYSQTNSNYPSWMPVRNAAAMFKGFVWVGDKLYFPKHADGKFVVVDANTGTSAGYELAAVTPVWSYKGNIAASTDGNIIACNLTLNLTSNFLVYSWGANPTASTEPTKLIEYTTGATDMPGCNYRLGYGLAAFGNFSSKEEIGYVVTASHPNAGDTNSTKILIWEVQNNVVLGSTPTIVDCGILLGSIPTITMPNANTIIVDGNLKTPFIFKKTGALWSKLTEVGNSTLMNVGANGASQFTFNSIDYIVAAANNHSTSFTAQPKNSVLLFMSPFAVEQVAAPAFPAAGLGSVTNDNYGVISATRVYSDSTIIYVCALNNGIAKYKLTDSTISVGLDELNLCHLYVKNGSVYVPSSAGKLIDIYTVNGQLIRRVTSESEETVIEGLPIQQLLLIKSGGQVAKVIL